MTLSTLSTLIADTRKAVADDAANAQAFFTAQGTLVGITEVDVRTGTHTFKVDEPPALGGADEAANPAQYRPRRSAYVLPCGTTTRWSKSGARRARFRRCASISAITSRVSRARANCANA